MGRSAGRPWGNKRVALIRPPPGRSGKPTLINNVPSKSGCYLSSGQRSRLIPNTVGNTSVRTRFWPKRVQKKMSYLICLSDQFDLLPTNVWLCKKWTRKRLFSAARMGMKNQYWPCWGGKKSKETSIICEGVSSWGGGGALVSLERSAPHPMWWSEEGCWDVFREPSAVLSKNT